MTDASALTDLIPALTRLSRRLAPDRTAAEDLAQEALVRVLARLAAGGDVARLGPYLMETARNLARRPGPRMLPLEAVAEPRVPAAGVALTALGDVAGALARLPAVEAAALIGMAVQGQSCTALAAAADLPPGTVLSRAARGRARLRAALGLQAGTAVATLLEGD
ncbi:MAG: hypothetical protein N2422_06015 [Rhodobacteraceae bacterium]|nr:hypothetical protein [Paracoccaceae bacterium]